MLVGDALKESVGVPPPLFTLTETAFEVRVLPAASRAIAVSVCVPFVVCVVFQLTE